MSQRTATPHAAVAGRFGRSAGSSTGRRPPRSPVRHATRRSAPSPATFHFRRRTPQQSTVGKAFQGLTGLLAHSPSKRGRRRSAPGGKGSAGLVVLAGAAGLALKNRDKLSSLMRRQDAAPALDAPAPTATVQGGERSATDTAPPSTVGSPSGQALP
jgi:hypothetical protein